MPMTEREIDSLKKSLVDGKVIVTFTKVSDGSKRTMVCTTNSALMPNIPQTVTEAVPAKKTRKTPAGTQAVWDLDNNGWRSFKFDNVIETSLSKT